MTYVFQRICPHCLGSPFYRYVRDPVTYEVHFEHVLCAKCGGAGRLWTLSTEAFRQRRRAKLSTTKPRQAPWTT